MSKLIHTDNKSNKDYQETKKPEMTTLNFRSKKTNNQNRVRPGTVDSENRPSHGKLSRTYDSPPHY